MKVGKGREAALTTMLGSGGDHSIRDLGRYCKDGGISGTDLEWEGRREEGGKRLVNHTG